MSSHSYFVSGGCGFLGQYVVKAIHDYDALSTICVVDLCPRPTLLGIESLPRVRVVPGDLVRPETFLGELHDVEAVIHCAGKISFKGGGHDNPSDENISGTKNILHAALAQNCPNFIFISSISAVDCRPGHLSDETMIPDIEEKRRTDPYGYSKLMGERDLMAEKERIRGIILNPSVILGPGSPLIDQVLRWLRWIPVCPMTTNINSFVDVRDVAKAVVLALSKGVSGERYIVTSENVDNLTFMAKVLAEMGKKVPVFPIPQALYPAYDFLAESLNTLKILKNIKKSNQIFLDKGYCNGKIRREMGWQPTFTLEQSLRYMILTPRERDEAKGQERLAYRSV